MAHLDLSLCKPWMQNKNMGQKQIEELSVFALSGNTDVTEVSRAELTVIVEQLTAQTQLACQSDAARQAMAGLHCVNTSATLGLGELLLSSCEQRCSLLLNGIVTT